MGRMGVLTNSTNHCNIIRCGILLLLPVARFLNRHLMAKALSGVQVQLTFHLGDLLINHLIEIGSLREVLADHAVPVLIQSPFPTVIGGGSEMHLEIRRHGSPE